MARSLALGLSVLAAGLLFVGAVAAAFGLVAVRGSEPEDGLALGVLFVSSALWAATTTLNAASLLSDSPLGTRRTLHAVNIASLVILAPLAVALLTSDTASGAEIAILALPAVAIPFGYWQAAKRQSGVL